MLALTSRVRTERPAGGEVTDLITQAEQAAALLAGPHAEVLSALVRGILAVASVQLQYAAAGDAQAGENARYLLSGLRVDLESRHRYPGLAVPGELFAA